MSTDSRPNVLLIATDHWPAAMLGCAGHPTVQTPTLDTLAGNGVRFTNAYSECPVCVPARRTLMTSLTPHSHGMLGNASMPMPEVPTLAQTFRDHGYQAMAVGKLHVQPQRNRIGFDDVILDEEGRGSESVDQDDYELFLGDHGHPGQRFAGGMCNNDYMFRPWHLPEELHVTNWAAQQMARQIIRRDPRKPGFWYLSFSQPHPPMIPLQAYLDLYHELEPPTAVLGDWASDNPRWNAGQIRQIRKAFYASATHIDHQLRVVLGTLRQHGLLDNTILCFTADHGDMLGDHGMWAKQVMYEGSANVPMLLSVPDGPLLDRVGHHRRDDRLVGLADIMPTLLDLAGLPIPDHCEGLSMVGDQRREYAYGLCGMKGPRCSRMIHDGRHKLIYYPHGNQFQLFDLEDDPQETRDLAGEAGAADVLDRLKAVLVERLLDAEQAWMRDGAFVGLPPLDPGPHRNPDYSGQRGTHWPPPPISGGR